MIKYNKSELSTHISITEIITFFYIEFPKDFICDGEMHDFWELVYIDNGEMLCTSNKSQFPLKSGELIIHKPNEFHTISGLHNSKARVGIISFRCNNLDEQLFEKKIFRLNNSEKAIMSMLFSEGTACTRMLDPINPLVQVLIQLNEAPYGSVQATKNALENLLINITRHALKEQQTNIANDKIIVPIEIQPILDYIDKHIYDQINLSDMSVNLGRSISYIKSKFHTYQNDSVINYFNNKKIELAKKMIHDNDYNFEEISNKLGYSSPQYFSRIFKRIAGVSPSEYKKSIIIVDEVNSYKAK